MRSKNRTRIFNLRLRDDEIARLHDLARSKGFKNTSEFVRVLIEQQQSNRLAQNSEAAATSKYPRPKVFHKTKLGRIYLGDSRGLLGKTVERSSVDLVMTSPPFGLLNQKEYGNEPADTYLQWFKTFAGGIREVLKDNGSLVIDIGPAWNRGVPTKSLYQFELLSMLCREYGFYLAQDFYWWNPCRMPAPAEWVNVRRLRAKDAVTPVWWLSPTPWPKASNRRVLTGYGADQQKLFERGYNQGRRPSGHVVSENWGKDNGGSVPPNLIAAPNTLSGEAYQTYCRDRGISLHPARFPWALPEFFIRMLTDEGDLVVDPFGGSCLTGAVAEHLNRRWICCEIERSYLEGAMGRFTPQGQSAPSLRNAGYAVPIPTRPQGAGVPLLACGGKRFREAKA
jgi:DNA modification methylase